MSGGHVDKLNTLYESFGHGEMQNEQWMEIVKAYNFRELSKPDDILRAFAGIAQFWSRSHPQRSLDASCYLAGLWKDQLPIQLLWYNFKKPERRPSRRNSRGDRVPIYLAPSWSWACINGFINMPPNLPPPDPFITTKCFFKSIFDFGPPVESAAALGIKAKKTAALLKPRDSNRNWADKLSLYDTSTGKSRRLWCDVWLDALQLNWIADPPDTVDVHCLQICPYDAGSRSGPCGLILMRMNESIYHRIGIFCFQKRKSEDAQQQSLFKDIHREIVTLI
ncbi:hypothetical protein H2203_002801 [Taxawa tesnikishii (nom. ined.)]|nr:hypothetical protein H2203_002801 [Dothideales sp. JES 119]